MVEPNRIFKLVEKISEQFGLTKWNKLLENIPTAFRTAFKTAANVAIAPLNLVISGIETMINNAIDLINGLMSAARLIPKIGDAVPNNIQHISVGRIPTFEKVVTFQADIRCSWQERTVYRRLPEQ